MSEYELNILKKKYHDGVLDLDEWNLLEQAISQGKIDLKDLPSLQKLEIDLARIPGEDTPPAVRSAVVEMIKKEKREVPVKTVSLREWMIRSVLAAAAMMTGVLIGYVIPGRSSAQVSEVAKLQSEMESLKETVMLNLLQKESTTDRLKAVSYSYELDQSSHRVINALLTTLNEDNNINVRLASVEALQQYGTQPWVRTQLVKSISRQHSPLVQVALAECMVALKEKTSVIEFKKLIDSKDTPEDIKTRLKDYIQQII